MALFVASKESTIAATSSRQIAHEKPSSCFFNIIFLEECDDDSKSAGDRELHDADSKTIDKASISPRDHGLYLTFNNIANMPTELQVMVVKHSVRRFSARMHESNINPPLRSPIDLRNILPLLEHDCPGITSHPHLQGEVTKALFKHGKVVETVHVGWESDGFSWFYDLNPFLLDADIPARTTMSLNAWTPPSKRKDVRTLYLELRFDEYLLDPTTPIAERSFFAGSTLQLLRGLKGEDAFPSLVRLTVTIPGLDDLTTDQEFANDTQWSMRQAMEHLDVPYRRIDLSPTDADRDEGSWE